MGTFIVVCALAVVACGSDDDAEQIEDVITQAATVDDPAHCTELMTTAFLEQTESSEDPLAACEESEAEGGNAAESVEVSNVEVDGDSASAEAAFTGGASDGQALALELVKEGDAWKLDRIVSFVEFDREAYLDAFAAEFEEEDASPDLAECAVDAVAALDDETIQDVALSGAGDEAAAMIADSCPAEYRAAVLKRFSEVNTDLSPDAQECVVAALEGLPDDQFADLTLGANQSELQAYIDSRCSA